jgi:hypothetical protein
LKEIDFLEGVRFRQRDIKQHAERERKKKERKRERERERERERNY